MAQVESYNNKLGNLEETKRYFFNKDFQNFTNALQQPFMFYFGEYERDENDDKKMEFILVNRNKGFCQNIPSKSVRELLIKFVCRKIEDKVTYDCMVISKTNQPLNQLMETDGFTFTSVTSEEVKEYFLGSSEDEISVEYVH